MRRRKTLLALTLAAVLVGTASPLSAQATAFGGLTLEPYAGAYFENQPGRHDGGTSFGARLEAPLAAPVRLTLDGSYITGIDEGLVGTPDAAYRAGLRSLVAVGGLAVRLVRGSTSVSAGIGAGPEWRKDVVAGTVGNPAPLDWLNNPFRGYQLHGLAAAEASAGRALTGRLAIALRLRDLVRVGDEAAPGTGNTETVFTHSPEVTVGASWRLW